MINEIFDEMEEAQLDTWKDMQVRKIVNMCKQLPVRMQTILDPATIERGDTLFYYRVIDTAWNRAIVIKATERYLTLMSIDTGFKGITWHVRRSGLLEPDDYLFDSL